jgi:hypothetical protein
VSCSSKCVAKLCRSMCGDTRFLSWRVESGRLFR